MLQDSSAASALHNLLGQSSAAAAAGEFRYGMFSPPVTRRPPMVPRNSGYGGASNLVYSSALLQPQPHMPSTSTGGVSFLDQLYHGQQQTASQPHRGGYDDLAVPNKASTARRAMLNKMRQHRSLEGDALSSSYNMEFSLPRHQQQPISYFTDCSSIPPADPQARPALGSPRYNSGMSYGAGPSSLGAAPSGTHYQGAYGGRSGGLLSTYNPTLYSGGGGFGTSLGAYATGSGGNIASYPGASVGGQHQQQQQNSFYDGMASSSFPISQPLTISTSAPPLLTSQSTNPLNMLASSTGFYNYFANRDPYNMSLPVLQREFDSLKREYESCIQKLNSCMNSVKTFWSPELKKERALRKEESTKLVLMQEQMKMASQEGQKHSNHIRQLQDELQCQYELSRTIRDTEMHSVPREEYEAVRLERDRLHRELVLSKDTMREFEIQIETQRQTLSSRDDSIKKLLDMLQSKGLIPFTAAQDRLELEQNRSRLIELECRCKSYESFLLQKDQDIHTLREECMNASQKLRQIQIQYDRYQRLPVDEREIGALQALLDTKTMRVEQLEQRIVLYEEEILKLREQRLHAPRNFTDKSVTDPEYQEMKLKMEKLQLELNQKQTEVFSMQAKFNSSEDHSSEAKKQLELLKEMQSNKDKDILQLQSDIETLRAKLEHRTETIEQKTQQLQAALHEKNRLQSEIFDMNEQLKIRDSKVSSLQRKLENNEEIIKDKEHQLEIIKQRLAASPAMVQQKQFQEQLEEVVRERDRLMQQLREQTDRVEAERFEELDLHRNEVRNLRTCIESLQKEITDRQMLIESQSEKIADLNRDLIMLKAECKRLTERTMGGDNFYVKETERLTKELHEARNEVDRLLKIVQCAEKEKDAIQVELRELEKQMESSSRMQHSPLGGSVQSMSSLDRRKPLEIIDEYKRRGMDVQSFMAQREQRVEELEEALKESVSITAERELAIAQQKQATLQTEARLNQYKEQMTRMQRQYEELNARLHTQHAQQLDSNSIKFSMRQERRKHLEEVLQLKEEALLAAISEKDAHIALLENASPSNKSADELNTLRRHKEKLIKKLKEENGRRMKLMAEMQHDSATAVSTDLNVQQASQSSKDLLKQLGGDQDDDAEGIWA